MRRLTAWLIVILLVLFPAGASARDLSAFSKEQRSEIVRFAANNSLFVLYHELMHLLVHQLDVPVLGREEDAADNMATWTLLSRKSSAAEATLADAAHGWILSGVAYNSDPTDEDFSAAHALDRQRAFQIVCLMVGSDARAFRPIANQYAIPRDRQNSCAWDYRLLNRSFRDTLKPLAKGKGGSDVVITYAAPGRKLKGAAEAFRSSGVFEEVARELQRRYAVRNQVRLTAERCEEANAFYDPARVEIIFCYELMEDFMGLYADELAAR